MRLPAKSPHDPIGWCMALAAGYFLLCLVRLTIPSIAYFDEVHYLPAARALVELSRPMNVEHPLLGKEMIASGIMLFGDKPFGWRIMSALFGTLTLFAFTRALWLTSLSRFAAIAGEILLASGFYLFVQSRIAMLDIFMVGLVMVALWALSGAVRVESHKRPRLAVAGLALGFALASKFNAAPIALLPGLALLALRIRYAGWSFLTSRQAEPLRGISLLEAAVWLGLLPLVAYCATYIPAFFYTHSPLTVERFIPYHKDILALQTQVLAPHPYQSRWLSWVMNWRAIWYLYEPVDGAQRGVLLIGNPFTMLVGLPALVWCAWAGIARSRQDALAVALLFIASLSLWWLADKPVQFLYHYFLPSCFLLAALALALDEMWKRKWRIIPLAALAISLGLFAWFYPILSSAPLPAKDSFATYTWLSSWR